MDCAIALFAYRRPVHLHRALSAICPQAKKNNLPVYIILDGPRGLDDRDDVGTCLSIAERFSCSQGVVIVRRECNRGLFSSLTNGISKILESHEGIIVLEDDILVSGYFVEYMLAGLELYASDEKVASVQAYVPNVSAALPETFFLRGADCWGWGTWRDRWQFFRSDAKAMAREIRQRGLVNRFNLGGSVDNLGLLDARASGSNNSWAICWHASCYLKGLYSLYPGHSLVQNIGLDATGEHCVPASEFEVELSNIQIKVNKIEVVEDPVAVRLYADHFRKKGIRSRIVNWVLAVPGRINRSFLRIFRPLY